MTYRQSWQAGTGRRTLLVSQVMKMAREHGPQGYRPGHPEDPYYEQRPSPTPSRRAARVGAAGAPALAAGGAVAGALACR